MRSSKSNQAILSHWSLSIPPENIRKTWWNLRFFMISGFIEIVEWNELMTLVQSISSCHLIHDFSEVSRILYRGRNIFTTDRKYLWLFVKIFPAGIYLLKVNNWNTRTRCEICSKLTIKTPKRHYWSRSGVFIVNCEHISHLVLVFLNAGWISDILRPENNN